MNKLGKDPAIALMPVFQMSFDNPRSIVVYVLNRLVWEINEWNIVEIPLRFVE